MSARKRKVGSAHRSIKLESNKGGDSEMLSCHSRIQEKFASHLATCLKDPAAQELQCCVTYGKPCGCIRKFVKAGSDWKKKSFPNLALEVTNINDEDEIAKVDRSTVASAQLVRAKELLDILQHAAELKKEKCYSLTTEAEDGKPLKELRGMIGLGNGRKRSKKYEDYVLEKRGKLRNDYSLCEKAAQKLLGYSINFLYKKLRTNPERTSRLVATNKAERASKVPRNLMSLEQLQEMANSQQSANQCCCRNCISWLVKHSFEKIVDWRHRLEGSGQRVAQEIVREVLLASDGQNSFCQNLVHYVTGCSFKKIRRIRDHLKKDPKSLPEHGLKKYWKEKVRTCSQPIQAGSCDRQTLTKTEKNFDAYPSASSGDGLPTQYDVTTLTAEIQNPVGLNQISLENTNARYDHGPCSFELASNPPPNQTVNNTAMAGVYPSMMCNVAYGNNDTIVYQQLQRSQQNSNPIMYMVASQQDSNMLPIVNVASEYSIQNNMEPTFEQNMQTQYQENINNVYPDMQNVNFNNQATQQSYNSRPIGSNAVQQHSNPNDSVIQIRPLSDMQHMQYQEPQSIQDSNYQFQTESKDNQMKLFPTPIVASFTDSSSNMENGQPSYFFTANAGNSQQDGLFHTGLTPLFITQAQQLDGNLTDQDNSISSQFASQPFFLLSPALPNTNDKLCNYTASDIENWKHMVMPLTPLQMYPASYYTPQGTQSEESDTRNTQTLGAEQHQFMFPVSDSNMPFSQNMDQNSSNIVQQRQSVNSNDKQQSSVQENQSQHIFQAALTPVAVMQPQGSNFISNVGWLSAQPQISQLTTQEQSNQAEKTIRNSFPYVQQSGLCAEEMSLPKSHENPVTEQAQIAQYISKDDTCYEAKRSNHVTNLCQINSNLVQNVLVENSRWNNIHRNEGDNIQNKKELLSEVLVIQTNDVSEINQFKEAPIVCTKMLPTTTADTSSVSVNVIEQNKANTSVSSSTESDFMCEKVVTPGSSPKGAAIGDRCNRFSRERLVATIDSPRLLAVTPATSSLTPIILPSCEADNDAANKGKEDDLSASSSNSQSLNNGIFQFPPAHVSRRLAALRMQGHTTAISKESMSKHSSLPTEEISFKNTDKPDAHSYDQLSKNSGQKSKNNVSENSEGSIIPNKDLSGSLESANSLGCIRDGFLTPNSTLLVDLANEKLLPVLNLPSSGWCDDNMSVNLSNSQTQPDSHLKHPIHVLKTPTYQLTPTTVQFNISTGQPQPLGQHTKNLPNQAHNAPTHELNNLTQPVNIPTDLTSLPTLSSNLPVNEELSMKVLMPAPIGRKRKANTDTGDSSTEKPSIKKPIRFHIFTPKDFASGQVNVSAFRKSEYVSGTIPCRKLRKVNNNPPVVNYTKSVQDQDIDKSSESVKEKSLEKGENEIPPFQSSENENTVFPPFKTSDESSVSFENVVVPVVGNSMQLPVLKTPAVLQRFTPLFNIPTSVVDDNSQHNTQQQLNTPVYSGALVTPSNRLTSAVLCKASPLQPGISGKSSSSTPQFFTFMPGSGFGTPSMFFTQPDTADLQSKLGMKPKSASTTPDGDAKSNLKYSPFKRSQMAFSFASSSKENTLHTPSIIQVITPTAIRSSTGLMSDMNQLFCFQDQSAGSTAKSVNSLEYSDETKEHPIVNVGDELDLSLSKNNRWMLENESSSKEECKQSEEPQKVPSLVVDPPSDSEGDGLQISIASNKKYKQTFESTQDSFQEDSAESKDKPKSLSSGDSSLQSLSLGSKGNLVLPVTTTNVAHSSGEQAYTISNTAASKSATETQDDASLLISTSTTTTKISPLSSKGNINSTQRSPLDTRIRPKSLMVTPVGLNPTSGNVATGQGNTGVQIATPTIFQIISPSQVTPPSPSVLMCPFPSRGFSGIAVVRGSGTSSSGSSGGSGSPFGVIQRSSVFCGNNSGSLLKSALIKKWPVFQFPPTVRPTSEANSVKSALAATSESVSTSTLDISDKTATTRPASEFCQELDSSNSLTSVSSTLTSTSKKLSDKLSGPNDPCLSESAQNHI